MTRVGRLCEIVRYPVKSMAGVGLDSAALGWRGIDGDRRWAFRRIGDERDFPWVSASQLPELLRYQPTGVDASGDALPTHARTPSGLQLALGSAELNTEISVRLGARVELMKLRHGVFDEADVSVISLATVAGLERAAGVGLDRRRFRANLVVETERGEPFPEDQWVGQILAFGDDRAGPALAVTQRDARCSMLNLDPDTSAQDPRVLKAVVSLNQNYAGVYATVVRRGALRVGDAVRLVSCG